jgi:hypothetical protein
MESLLNPVTNKNAINRISKLTPGSRALWGKMNVSQMMAHCSETLRTAFGEVKLKRSIPGILFGRIAKKSIISGKPFKQGLPTDKSFVMKDEKKFDEEQKKLVGYVEKLGSTGDAIFTNEAHPFFGYLTVNEWDMLMTKHLDHHLRQFGV